MTSVCEKSSPLNSIGRPRDLAENDRTDGRRVYDDHVGSPWASHASGSRDSSRSGIRSNSSRTASHGRTCAWAVGDAVRLSSSIARSITAVFVMPRSRASRSTLETTVGFAMWSAIRPPMHIQVVNCTSPCGAVDCSQWVRRACPAPRRSARGQGSSIPCARRRGRARARRWQRPP